MSFLGNLFKKKEEYFAEEPITGYDPTHSEQKVNDYLGTSDGGSDQLAFEQQVNDPLSSMSSDDMGLPPDTSINNQDFAMKNPAQMPSGVNAQQMADKYIRQQEVSQNNVQTSSHHDDEIINLKLDSMKNQLDAINQRIQKIEQLLQNKNSRNF